MSAVDSLPPTTELYNKSQLVQRHPHLLSDHRVAWALRNRKANGLSKAGAVFDSPCGELLIHEPVFYRGYLASLVATSRAHSVSVGP